MVGSSAIKQGRSAKRKHTFFFGLKYFNYCFVLVLKVC